MVLMLGMLMATSILTTWELGDLRLWVTQNPEVLDLLLKTTMEKGTSFGAPGPLENELAKMVIDAVPSVEMVRFTNSGTEACMGMLRLARAYTGRETIIKFDGCYHGHADSFLVQAGSGVATLGLPDSPGVPVVPLPARWWPPTTT